MNSKLTKVIAFHERFDHNILKHKGTIESENAKFRLNLLFEELSELAVAFGEHEHLKHLCAHEINKPTCLEPVNNVAVLDAHADLMYVLCGSIIESGQQYMFDGAFEEVHQSNMTKTCKPENLVEELNKFQAKGVEVDYFETEDNMYRFKRKSDGKAVKPSCYKPADLGRFYNF